MDKPPFVQFRLEFRHRLIGSLFTIWLWRLILRWIGNDFFYPSLIQISKKKIRPKIYLKSSKSSIVLGIDMRSILVILTTHESWGQHGHFTVKTTRIWLKKAERNDLTQLLRRLAQLNQSKVYLFWKCRSAQSASLSPRPNVCSYENIHHQT